MIRPGRISYGLTRFAARRSRSASWTAGFDVTTATTICLGKGACGRNFTTDADGSVRRQQRARHARPGHDRRHRQRRQPLPGRGPGGRDARAGSIRAAKVLDRNNNGSDASWMRTPWTGWPAGLLRQPGTAGDQLQRRLEAGYGLTGTDSTSRKLDHGSGSTASSTWSPPATRARAPGPSGPPASPKNALTVGSVLDIGYFGLGRGHRTAAVADRPATAA